MKGEVMFDQTSIQSKTQARFIENVAGQNVGMPLIGDGQFGRWALADVTWKYGMCHRIVFDRDLEPEEMSKLMRAPYMRWATLFVPKYGSTWALGVCKPMLHASVVIDIVPEDNIRFGV